VFRLLTAAVGLFAWVIAIVALGSAGVGVTDRLFAVAYLAVGAAMMWAAWTTEEQRLRDLLGPGRHRLLVGGLLGLPALLVLGASWLTGLGG
jgi:hypothetical protein